MEQHEWIEEYELLDLIDQGRTAEVHRASHKPSKGKEIVVAIKILHEFIPNREPEIQEKFLEQVEISKTLDHPHIVKIIKVLFKDTELHRGTRPCIVMPYVPGGTLRKQFNNGNLLPLETIRSYTRQLADALSYAHKNGVAHCDVKPENILLDNDGSNLFLTDFGIARIISETFSSTSVTTQSPSGTDVYMAPEQFKGKGSRRSDQYALALIIYESLCGHPPFVGANYEELREQHLHARIPSLRKACQTRGRKISKNTERVISQALTKHKNGRYSSIQAFASALDKALTREIEPRPLIKYDIAGAIGSVVGCLAGVAAFLWFLNQPSDVPQQFSIGQTLVSNVCELLYVVFVLTGLGCALAWLIRRQNTKGRFAVASFILAAIFFCIQYFFARPRFTLEGQLRFWEFLIFGTLVVAFLAGLFVAGVGSLFVWCMNKIRRS